MKTCETCRWWGPNFVLNYDGNMLKPEKSGEGDCRLRAPHHENRWPKTFNDDWCGEHQPREGGEPDAP